MMKLLRYCALGILIAAASVVQAQSPATGNKGTSDREKLIGAWHLAHIDAVSNSNTHAFTPPEGMLIYTRDGHLSFRMSSTTSLAVPRPARAPSATQTASPARRAKGISGRSSPI